MPRPPVPGGGKGVAERGVARLRDSLSAGILSWVARGRAACLSGAGSASAQDRAGKVLPEPRDQLPKASAWGDWVQDLK